MTRHKITIHVLNISDPLNEGLGTSNIFGNTSLRVGSVIKLKDTVKDSDYLTGLDENDIKQKSVDGITKESITIGSANLPGIHAELLDGFNEYSVYPVLLDAARKKKYVEIYSSEAGTKRYYIKAKEVPVKYDVYSERSFTFYVNPSHITPTYRKLVTETRTHGGWNVQQWGNALSELRVQGKSGGLHRNYVDISDANITSAAGTVFTKGNSEISGITQTVAWKKLKELKTLYRYNNGLYTEPTTLGLNYFDMFYIGYFTEFSGPEADAEIPYQVNYSFSFKITQEIPLRVAELNIEDF